ncbi:protein MAIN-LIKE 1-like [Nicotiana tomentosiformis]|uniref:protein MAIN-LIKE 1-like n=1 Tax=Nicotiana tomentosiformis TaxID=4098 RepID=UPI00051BF090|nr:serine/threonine-protein phosphatase 7 long form homolog [Nicotiana tomentosiformis]
MEIDRLQFDWALITAMIGGGDRRHTHYLPIREATIKLEHMEVIFGLLVDGMHVAYPHVLRDYTREDYLNMLQRLTGFQLAEPTALSGTGRSQLTPVRQHLVALYAEITDDSAPEDIDQQTRMMLLMMFGGILFPNTSENLVSLRFLQLMVELL